MEQACRQALKILENSPIARRSPPEDPIRPQHYYLHTDRASPQWFQHPADHAVDPLSEAVSAPSHAHNNTQPHPSAATAAPAQDSVESNSKSAADSVRGASPIQWNWYVAI